MRAHVCYIYIRGEFIREREHLQAAIDEAYDAKLIGKNNINGWDFDLYVHHGAGAYICGEETALLESLEGKKGQPRLKPPFPANVGLYGAPTTVNNVEIHRRRRRLFCAAAPTWFAVARHARTIRAPSCSASRATSNKPCNVEEEMGIPLRELIEQHAGGVRGGWDNLLAVIPGGASVPCMPADQSTTCRWTSTGCRKLRAASAPPPSSSWTSRPTYPRHRPPRLILQARELRPVHALPRRHRLDVAGARAHGRRPAPRSAEIDMLLDVTYQVEGHTICALGDAAAWPVQGLIRHFRHVIEQRGSGIMRSRWPMW